MVFNIHYFSCTVGYFTYYIYINEILNSEFLNNSERGPLKFKGKLFISHVYHFLSSFRLSFPYLYIIYKYSTSCVMVAALVN